MDGICYIVGSRPPGEIALARGRAALVIAADGGLRHLEAQGLTADLIVGDFDSLGRVPEGDNILRHPVEKDDTDMLLAVRTGLDRGSWRSCATGSLCSTAAWAGGWITPTPICRC